MYSITFSNFWNYSFNAFNRFDFISISDFLFPPCWEISFKVSVISFSFNFLLYKSLEMAFLIVFTLTFFNF